MQTDVRGAGLGLRRALLTELQASLVTGTAPDFFELAPENWLDVGGKFALALENLRAQRPLVAHGLSLSLGGIDALDGEHLHAIKAFLARWEISIYSEHLSASAIHGHLYDLAPIAFTEDMLAHLCERIQRTQAFLGRRIAVENSSYYLSLAASMSELEFIVRLLEQADCELLLDVNNLYVNSQNHGYDSLEFLARLPSERIRYLHVAGHDREYSSDGTIVDTHGSDVDADVWQLLHACYAKHGQRATLLERDFNFPHYASLALELQTIRDAQAGCEHNSQRGMKCQTS